MKSINLLFALSFLFMSCNSDETDCCADLNQPQLVIKLKFDPNQERLNNIGQPATIPVGNAAQSPVFSKMSANYIELAPNAFTLLGEGEIIFEGPETNMGGNKAIDFQNALFAGNNETIKRIHTEEARGG